MIHLYTLCWNEVDMLGFFFRHYDPWVDRYVVYDDGSTDGSIELLTRHPKVELRRFERTDPDSFVLSHQVLHNNAWKESRGRAAWVVVTALDEHLHIADRHVSDYLDECRRDGVTLIPALGYQMISEGYPAGGDWLCKTHTRGAPWPGNSKLSIFNPDAVSETGFAVGRHGAAPEGELRLPLRDELMLLHYKHLNFERTYQRHQAESYGLGKTDVRNGWGCHYNWSPAQLREERARIYARAVDVGGPGFQPWICHDHSRWWRTLPLGENESIPEAPDGSGESHDGLLSVQGSRAL